MITGVGGLAGIVHLPAMGLPPVGPNGKIISEDGAAFESLSVKRPVTVLPCPTVEVPVASQSPAIGIPLANQTKLISLKIAPEGVLLLLRYHV